MIDIIPNASYFRRVPFQSGNYGLELDILLDNHNHDINFALSGGGSIFFRFGSNSGNYYASGSSRKLYFDATTPNSDLNYSFVIGNTGYDVYDEGGNPLILGGSKASGICERVYVNTTQDAAGEFSLILRGERPSFSIASGLTFPFESQYNDALVVTNTTNVPFYLLSGTIDSIDSISGANKFPIFVNAQNTATINFSGQLAGNSDQAISLILNSDFINTANVITITGTKFSGSGYTLTIPDVQTANFAGATNALWFVNNTGTTNLTFTPTVTKIVSGISIVVPTYSGTPLRNHYSGYLDTSSALYFSDKLTWTGGAFHIIQNNSTGINFINITGGVAHTGLMAGTTSGFACGQSFTLPFNFQVTGISATLAATGLGFTAIDNVFVAIFEGRGVSGARVGVSNAIPCLSMPSGLTSGSGFYFRFTSPIDISANNPYSFVLTGNPEFVGNTSSTSIKHIMWIHNSGNPYVGESGFVYNGTDTLFTGDALMSLDWMPPLNANRYKINVVNGALNNFFTVDSGTYDKYQGHLSFSFENSVIEALPNRPVSIEMQYSGLVSGVNFAQINFPELGYQTIISGETI